MRIVYPLAAALMIVPLATPSAASAQYDDIALRSQAIDECSQDPGYLGYGNYDVCVESRYQDLLQQSGSSPPPSPYPGPGNFDQTCNSAATRIRCGQ